MHSFTLLAQSISDPWVRWVAGGVFALMAIFVMIVMLIARFYKRCPSNRVLVIYGRTG